MYDYSKLIGRIVEKYGSREMFAAALPMSMRTLSLKLNNKRKWNQAQIDNCCKKLEIPDQEISAYFFTLKV